MKYKLLILFILTFLCQILYSQVSNEYLIKSVFLEDLSSEDISLDNYNRGDFLLTLFNIYSDYEFRNQIIKLKIKKEVIMASNKKFKQSNGDRNHFKKRNLSLLQERT